MQRNQCPLFSGTQRWTPLVWGSCKTDHRMGVIGCAGPCAQPKTIASAPVPFYKDPSAAASHPMSRDPDRTRTRWQHIMARHPDIPHTIPAVIASNPYVARVRRRAWMLHHNRGWRNTNNDLRKRRRGQGKGENSSKGDFLHEVLSLQKREHKLFRGVALKWPASFLWESLQGLSDHRECGIIKLCPFFGNQKAGHSGWPNLKRVQVT